jgi:hypothetical protein
MDKDKENIGVLLFDLSLLGNILDRMGMGTLKRN